MNPQDRTRAILRSRLEPAMRLLLVAIADHMNPQDVCWVKPETMAEETGLARSTVILHLTALEQAGILRRWSGEHKAKDHAIDWDALAGYQPPTATKRGGAKRGPNIGQISPNIGRQEGSDNRTASDRTSDGRGPNIGPDQSEHRTRSDQEAIIEAPRKRPLASATADEMDFGILFHGNPRMSDWVRRLDAAEIRSVPDLCSRSPERLRRTEGIGEDRAVRMREALQRHGLDLATDEPKPRSGAPPGEDAAEAEALFNDPYHIPKRYRETG